MTALSRGLVRAALVHLIAAAALGGAVLAGVLSRAWIPLHVEWIVIGFACQFALGVAWWVLPRPVGSGEVRVDPRWPALPVVLMSGGALAGGLAPALGLPDAILMGGRLAEIAGAALVAVPLAPRVRAALEALPPAARTPAQQG